MEDHFIQSVQHDLDTHFGFLARNNGFQRGEIRVEPRAFDNFIVCYTHDEITIRLTRDRSQVFIEFLDSVGQWRDKDILLEELGIDRTRYPTVGGVWTGYDIENQGLDLATHLHLLLDHLYMSGDL